MRLFYRARQFRRFRLLLSFLVLGMLTVGLTCSARGSSFGLPTTKVVINGIPIIATSPAVNFDNRTYIPLSSLEENLNLYIEWAQDGQLLLINSYQIPELEEVNLQQEYKGHRVIPVVINNQIVEANAPAVKFDDIPYISLRTLEELGLTIGWDKNSQTAYIGTLSPGMLPTVGTAANMKRLLGVQLFNFDFNIRMMAKTSLEALGSARENTSSSPAADNSSASFSETNIQVAGVDESDIVKTDGRYIYQVRNNMVTISQAYPINAMQVVKDFFFASEGFHPTELYVDDRYMVIIGHGDGSRIHQPEPENINKRGIDERPASSSAPAINMKMDLMPYWSSVTKAIIYDISDKESISLVREVELEGGYLSSRKIGSKVYLMANQYLGYNQIAQPHFRDTALSQEYQAVDYKEIKYFMEQLSANYLLIAAFDLDAIEQGAIIEVFLGAGNNIYMSHESLYVAVSKHPNTVIYKFNVDGTDVDFQAKGQVPGSILNQFSMDEHNGHFRIATTTWGNRNSNGLSNNVYVLNEDMIITGKIENIAPNEQIYSARFMGDKGYLVTFELVDPLFVIDLSDPHNPHILGELKIPGFSNYLHPLDENHLLGIGKDTTVSRHTDRWGNPTGAEFALELGMKLAIFDVSDVNNPIEKHVEIIGGRGTHSEVLYNHKALLFDQRNNLLVLPITIYEPSKDMWSYGPLSLQGALVYDVDLENGFKLSGEVSHLSDGQMGSNYYWSDFYHTIRRSLYIDQHLYFISDSRITAHDIVTLDEQARLDMEIVDPYSDVKPMPIVRPTEPVRR